MTRDEVVDLLHFASNYDHRHLTGEETAAWHRALGRLEFDEAMAAVAEHYQAETRRVMPADVQNRCRPPASRHPSSVPVPVPLNVTEGASGRGRAGARQLDAQAHAANQARRERVLRHPDLARRLTEPPLGYPEPGIWNGYVPPAESQDEAPEAVHSSTGIPNRAGKMTGPRGRNNSPRRAALVDICTEALRRERRAS